MSKTDRQAMVEDIGGKKGSKEEERDLIEQMESKSKKSREEGMMKEIKEEKVEFKIRKEAMMSKIENMSNVEDTLFRELKESREKSLQLELAVVTLTCLGISLIVFLSLRH
eukprot:CAMPEP_0203719522 /NCGR_PEP_ID=MMETSP0092-20131115/3542_1 /ASSEMBLY_ACC=CAM_ASM_001090 /TAXON_ID=426623 /ORGANISM="Chaetoceros affinis, Strain CCMP159" /LENGTH=110 /DNA_ID=CAMNT_0050598951 /DNA_START=436 /DNA_END=769 /DNA_ORIENTATION=+